MLRRSLINLLVVNRSRTIQRLSEISCAAKPSTHRRNISTSSPVFSLANTQPKRYAAAAVSSSVPTQTARFSHKQSSSVPPLFPPNSESRRDPEMAKLIDGKQIAEDIRNELKTEIQQWMAAGNRAPQLTAVLVGEDPASCTYVRNKMKVNIGSA